MTKVATLSARILSRKGTAQPMPANTPLIRGGGSAAVAIDWQTAPNSRAPLTLTAPPRARRRNGDDRAYRRVEPRVRVSLRLDRDRHARFKSVCALVRRSQQAVLTQALDEYFARHGLDEAAGERRRPLPE
jgi:hypothetical protein